jgi:hypothetical protein
MAFLLLKDRVIKVDQVFGLFKFIRKDRENEKTQIVGKICNRGRWQTKDMF